MSTVREKEASGDRCEDIKGGGTLELSGAQGSFLGAIRSHHLHGLVYKLYLGFLITVNQVAAGVTACPEEEILFPAMKPHDPRCLVC